MCIVLSNVDYLSVARCCILDPHTYIHTINFHQGDFRNISSGFFSLNLLVELDGLEDERFLLWFEEGG